MGVLEMDSDLMDEARRLSLDPALIAERAVRRAVRERRTPEEREALGAAWRDENADALAEHRRWIEENGLPLADLAIFQLPKDDG